MAGASRVLVNSSERCRNDDRASFDRRIYADVLTLRFDSRFDRSSLLGTRHLVLFRRVHSQRFCRRAWQKMRWKFKMLVNFRDRTFRGTFCRITDEVYDRIRVVFFFFLEIKTKLHTNYIISIIIFTYI